MKLGFKKSPPQPSLPKDLIAWLLLVALATIAPHSAHLPLWLSALAGAAWLWRAWLWKFDALLPSRYWLFTLVLIGVSGIAWQFGTLLGRDAGVALLVFFSALKPLELRNLRDAIVLVMLGFFVLLTHYFYSQSIPTGLWLLAVAGLLTATLIRLHGGTQSIWGTLRYAALLMAQAIPFLLIVFVLFPRVNGPLWGLPQDAHSGATGLSHEMSPGSMNNLIQSGSIAFRVQFTGEMPEKSQLYWRGPTLYNYDGKTWRAARFPSLAAPSIEPRGKNYRYVTSLEPHNQRWLLALDLPTALPSGSALSPSLDVLAKEPVRARARFSFNSSADYTVNRQESDVLLQSALQLPAGRNPKTQALAQSWRQQFKTPEAISNAALQYFRNEQFFYTLQPKLLGEHAIDDFLFNSRQGFCEHYAAAYVALMRAVGIPARVVTGYQGGTINPVDGYLMVRQSDAHAWAEIWIAERGWLRVDPTAAVSPLRIEQGIEAALPIGDTLPGLLRVDSDILRSLRNRWEAVNNSWNQWVIGYNAQRQQDALEKLGLGDFSWSKMVLVLSVLCALLLLLVSVWMLYQRRTLSPAQRAWQAFCRRLARHSIERRIDEGPRDFAARAIQESRANAKIAHVADFIEQAADCFIALHYAKPVSAAHNQKNLTQLKRLRRLIP